VSARFLPNNSLFCGFLVFLVYFLSFDLSLFVSTSANDCLERLVSEMICYVSNKT